MASSGKKSRTPSISAWITRSPGSLQKNEGHGTSGQPGLSQKHLRPNPPGKRKPLADGRDRHKRKKASALRLLTGIWVPRCMSVCMYVKFSHSKLAKKRPKLAQNFLPPAAGETPDPCHLSGPDMMSYTLRAWGSASGGQTRKRVRGSRGWRAPEASLSMQSG